MQFFANHIKPVYNLIIYVVNVAVLVQSLDSFRYELGVTLVEGLGPVFTRRLDRYIVRRSLEDRGALTGNNER